MKWLDKKVAQVQKAWRENRLTYGQAMGELVRLGWTTGMAADWLAT